MSFIAWKQQQELVEVYLITTPWLRWHAACEWLAGKHMAWGAWLSVNNTFHVECGCPHRDGN